MMFLLLIFALARVGFCDDSFGLRLSTEKIKSRENMNYFHRYYVQDDLTGDYKTQEEMKKGDSVRGSYTVAEPNENFRKVTYNAGPGRGFEAVVIEPKGSPTMETLVSSTSNLANLMHQEMESNKQGFPEGFVIGALRQGNPEVETKMKLLKKRENNTKIGMTTEVAEVDQTTSRDFGLENFGLLVNQTSLRESTKDFVEERINEAMDSLPKAIPNFILPNNKSHLKDPEKALLEERISQIARQLAETDLRQEYERKKLGHYLPISVTPVRFSTPPFLSKAIKFTANEAPESRSSLAPPAVVTTEKPEPQYKKSVFSKLFPSCNRLPALKTKTATQENLGTMKSTDLKEVNQLLKMALPEMTLNDDDSHMTPGRELGHWGDQNFRFFTPNFIYKERSHHTAKNPEMIAEPLILNLTTGSMPVNEDALFAANKNYYSTEKS